jgi:hypothetical protein
MNNFDTQFLDWIQESKHFDDENGLPDLNQIHHLQISEDRKVCWAIGYTSIGNRHSVIFDDYDDYIIQDLDYQDWEKKLNQHKTMFELMK